MLLDARTCAASPIRCGSGCSACSARAAPSTATRLGARVGESSAATSYHLRQLEAYGFVVEDTTRGTARERWWRFRPIGRPTSTRPPMTPTRRACWERSTCAAWCVPDASRMEAWVDALPTVPRVWRDAANMSDYRMRLTPAEAVALVEQLEAIGLARRDDDATEPPDPAARRVSFQFQVLPDPGDVAEAPDHG